MSIISRYFTGTQIFFTGWSLFWGNKSLRRLAFAPLIISLLVLVLGLFTGWELIPWAIGLITPILGTSFSGFVLFLVTAIFHLIYAVLLIVFIFLFANILGIPFNTLIAEKTMNVQNAEYFQPKGKQEWLKFNLSMLMTGLIKTALVLCFGILIFVLSFIPILGAMATFMGLFILAFDSCDYGLELKNKSLGQRWTFAKEHFWQLCGYTTVLTITFFIPGLNIFLLPIFVTAGTNYVAQNVSLESRKLP